jgi:ABC-2 type transport system ATP-binding protein
MVGTAMSAIATTGLCKTYRTLTGRKHEAVAGLDLSVAEGTIFGLLGPNGAGKTTTIMMLLGILHPTAGTFSLFGQPMRSVGVRSRVGYLPEKFQLPGFLKAREFLRYQSRLHGLRGAVAETRITDLLAKVGLADRADSPIAAYSKGMQQRLGLAQALLNDPDLIILDEPTSALDPVGRMDVRAVIEDLKSRGKTVLLNSHILSDVERVCDSVAILRKGRLERQGTISALASSDLELQVRVSGFSDGLGAQVAALGRNFQLHRDGEITEMTLLIPGEVVVPQVADAVAAAGARLYALTPSRESLEDLFVRVMKEDK